MLRQIFGRFRFAFFLIFFISSVTVFIAYSTFQTAQSGPDYADDNIFVDQFGYRLDDQKIGIIVESSDFDKSYDAEKRRYQLIDLDSNRVVYENISEVWNNGHIHEQSGDRVSWFDFSSVSQPGRYEIRDLSTGKRSAQFRIERNPYRQVLVAAVRMFYYQRSGFPKEEPYADRRWIDGPAFLGPHQDTEAHFVDDKENASLVRDMRGGWFDAGDTNKYVIFANTAVHQLLDAYRQNPSIWTDDFGIPESGNGIPDLIDEIQFETDWLERMQDDDGGVFIKLGTLDHNAAEKPSLDRRPRYYGPKCSSSTIAVSSMFAHAAWVFQDLPGLSQESNRLKEKAIAAWQWYNSHPHQTDCDTQEIKAGDADATIDEQNGMATSAAIYLFALTKNADFDEFITQSYESSCFFCYDTWPIYNHSLGGDALLTYTELSFANPDFKEVILDRFRNLVENSDDTYGLQLEKDPYLAYMPDDQYHWGSNSVKANYGLTNYDAFLYEANSQNIEEYKIRSLGSLHYLHGVNPLGIVYLTNMYDYGAQHSANEMFHQWLGHGIYDNALSSPSGPAPGYLTGGVNRDYTGDAPILNQPIMKRYLDSNDSDLKMWEVTEPAIYYQSAYVKLLSKFCS